MANWGAVARGVLGGASTAVDSQRERTRELLIAEQRRREQETQQRILDARAKKEEQDATYEEQDRVVKAAEQAKKTAAEAAEEQRRQKSLPLRVRIARDLMPELKDQTQYDDATVGAFVSDENNWKQIISRTSKEGSQNPIMGSPEWRAAKTFEAQLGAQYRAPREQSEPSWQTVQTDEGLLQVNPKTSETRPVIGPDGQQLQKPLTGTIQKAIATNSQTMTNVDEAIRLLDAHPDAIGLKRMGPDALNQRLDPGGVDARAMIANVGSLVLHDRSGAAVTVSEWPRLAPFIPRMGDNAATAKRKLTLLKKAMEIETAELRSGGRGAASSPTTTSAGSPSETPQQRAARLRAKYGVH